jgi:21S rRNA (GM2251-2'-O)-methyltransferase
VGRHACQLNPCFTRALSVNAAIGRGLRKSQGVGFRGKERDFQARPKDNSPGRSQNQRGQEDHQDFDVFSSDSRSTKDAWNDSKGSGSKNIFGTSGDATTRLRRGKVDIKDIERPARRSRAARFHDPESSFGKKSLSRGDSGRDARATGGKSFQERGSRGSGTGRQRPSFGDSAHRRGRPDHTVAARGRRGPSWEVRVSPYLGRTADSAATNPHTIIRSAARYGPDETQENFGRESTGKSFEDQESNEESVSSRRVDDKLPLSIPYTTPASEFLYGTSVVEAALKSQRTPRRKLYKFYIYSGERRHDKEKDKALAQLARRNNVGVIRVSHQWARTLDKMSGGRPHNGYILEASPLPKLPVFSLGPVTRESGIDGFSVVLDHQSREEKAVNGEESFIRLPKRRESRNPFILLLDSILDPGNLGGIIRTASFMGVTAIAVSTRSSAPFSPVVLKASAGASENIRIFSVNKPAGFVKDSKAAGWKVYAAVAPPGPAGPQGIAPSVMLNKLEAPLDSDPCILMLGGEGEGLRWSLRGKADVEVVIEGSSDKAGVDSLNVSVAAGILCNTFLKSSGGGSDSAKAEPSKGDEKPGKDLF